MSARLSFLLVHVVLLAAACGDAPPAQPAGPRTVVLISLDTLRPDRLSVYGNDAEVSPVLDAFAKEAVVFDQALAPSPWTLPSHMTMLTGLDPVAHGMDRPTDRLSRYVHTLSEILSEGGYQTGGFTDGGFVLGDYGFRDGFDVFDDERNPGADDVNGFSRLLPDALKWLRGREGDDVFMFLHTFDAHSPYDHGDPEVIEHFRKRPTPDDAQDRYLHLARYMHQQNRIGIPGYGRLSQLLNDYDAGVFECDRGVGRVLEVLRETGRYDGALVIVTSDHGESFFDEGLHVGHGLALTNDELSIPLIVKFPASEGAGRRLATLVGLMDIAPTVLDVAGLPPSDEMHGESLRDLVRGEPRRRETMIAMSSNAMSYALIWNGHKYITTTGVPPLEVAKRHLGPMMPEMGKWAGGKRYRHPAGGNPVKLMYDDEGDPLGLRDVLDTGPRLYRLEAGREIPIDLADAHPDIPRTMAAELMQRIAESESVFKRLEDPEAEDMFLNPHKSQALAQLGYVVDGSDENYRNMSRPMRESFQDPHEPPDMRDLDVIDAKVHFARLRLREGRLARPQAREILQQSGDAYIDWWRENPAYRQRVVWRVLDLLALAGEASIPLDLTRWTTAGLQLGQAPTRDPREATQEPEPDR